MTDWTCINCSYVNHGGLCRGCGTPKRATEPKNMAVVVVRTEKNTGPVESRFRSRVCGPDGALHDKNVVQTFPDGIPWG